MRKANETFHACAYQMQHIIMLYKHKPHNTLAMQRCAEMRAFSPTHSIASVHEREFQG